MIISIGFRVNSKTAIKFRTWANKLIKEYMVKGFTLNDDRFINGNRFNPKEITKDSIFFKGDIYDAYSVLLEIFNLAKDKC